MMIIAIMITWRSAAGSDSCDTSGTSMILGLWATHRDTPMRVIERIAVPPDHLPHRLRAMRDLPGVRESFLLSTCNRVEAYVVVDDPASGPAIVDEVLGILVGPAALPLAEVRESMVIDTAERVVRHVVSVACGLDSMVIGEYQIVAQLRQALRAAAEADVIGPVLDSLIRLALRTGKRARSTTAIGATSRSMVSVGLGLAATGLGGLADKSGLLIGAGKMGALAGPLLRQAGVGSIAVTNRTPDHARHLADRIAGHVVDVADLIPAISVSDVVVSSTGAPGHMVVADQVAEAMRPRPDTPLFVLDLALPRDIDPEVRQIPQVTVVDIEDIGAYLCDSQVPDNIAVVGSMVGESVEEYQRWRDQRVAAPVIGALRAQAGQMIEAETRRLHRRLPDLDERSRREADATVRRVVHKLLHAPTVRAKELAMGPDGSRYLEALTALFDLDSPDTLREDPS